MQFKLELTPEPEAKLEAEREERLAKYRRDYWQRYKAKHPRVYGTLTESEHAEIKAIAKANGRSVWEQIWLESCAYRQKKYVPSEALKDEIGQLYAELRRIGNNLNQIARRGNIFGRLSNSGATAEYVEQLENAVARFVSRPWRISDPQGRKPEWAPPGRKSDVSGLLVQETDGAGTPAPRGAHAEASERSERSAVSEKNFPQ